MANPLQELELAESIFGAARGVDASESLLSELHATCPQAQALTSRLMGMNPEAPVAGMIRAGLATGDNATISALHGALTAPTEARLLMTHDDVLDLTKLLTDGSPQSLVQAQNALGTIRDLGTEARPDLTQAELLRNVRLGGINGENTWVGRNVHLKS